MATTHNVSERTFSVLVIVLGIAAILTTLYGVAIAAVVSVPECHTEDSAQTVCRWDAHHFGNGQGRSFIKVGDKIVYYGS